MSVLPITVYVVLHACQYALFILYLLYDRYGLKNKWINNKSFYHQIHFIWNGHSAQSPLSSMTFHNVIVFQCYSLYFITHLAKYTEVKNQLKQSVLHEYQWLIYRNANRLQTYLSSLSMYIVPIKKKLPGHIMYYRSHYGSFCRRFLRIFIFVAVIFKVIVPTILAFFKELL